MQRAPIEVVISFFAFILFWPALVGLVLARPRWWKGVEELGARMLAQRKVTLIIAGIYLLCGLIGAGLNVGRSLGTVMTAPAVFCQLLIGLALAYGIKGFEPLPVARAVIKRDRPWRAVAVLLLVSVAAGVLGLFVGSIGMGIVQDVVGEVSRTAETAAALPFEKWQAFFALLAGAGITEEAVYRLVIVSAVWKVTGKAWLGIVVGAVVFAAYHLTPIDTLYLEFWRYPVSQFVSTFLIGLLWGYLYTRRGFETAVLGHTMSDLIAVLVFT